MPTHQFRFVVSDVDLTRDQVEHVERAIAQAGALALADLMPEDAVTCRVRPGWLWKGLPPVDILEPLTEYASRQE
jgi:hypothetical protein